LQGVSNHLFLKLGTLQAGYDALTPRGDEKRASVATFCENGTWNDDFCVSSQPARALQGVFLVSGRQWEEK